jgi:predicted alpha/beta-fold hydrolase
VAPRVALSGHLWTVAPALASFARRPPVPPARPFRLALADPVAGALALSGRLHEPPGARTLIVVLHGLGGSCESSYARRFARAAYAAGPCD